MADLKLEHIYKVYPNGTKAVSDFTMEIKDKEFIVFVGPSGCGKSTTLRMIAGLEDISAGELYIDGRIVNDVEPKDRDIAMVFQNYALYPHMTVYENMAFGLELRHVPNNIIHEKVLWAAKVLGLTEYLDRKPKAMSGGQRQRVALGRAILRNPKVMLLDEPLSNLDAKLRAQMRSEIAQLHNDLQTTFIYVTHDQVEAMTLGTRVVVMKLGRIQQIDTPKNLYDYPANKFVAGFIGTPQMNFFDALLTKNGKEVTIEFAGVNQSVKTSINTLVKLQPLYLDGKHKVSVGLRCEHVSIDPEVVKASSSTVKIKISHFEELGNETLIYGDLNLNVEDFKNSETKIIIKGTSTYGYKNGDVIDVALDLTHCHMFDAETEDSVMPRIPEMNIIDCSIENGVLHFEDASVTLPSAISSTNGSGLLRLPNKAILLGKGNISATVVASEKIGDVYLTYIKVGERILFVTTTEEYKVGKKVTFAIDFTNIEVTSGEDKILTSLPEFDSYDSRFINLVSLKDKACQYNEAISSNISSIEEKYNAKVNAVKEKLAQDVAAAQKEDVASIVAANQAKLAELTAKNKQTLAAEKEEMNKKVAVLKKEFKEEKAKIKNEVWELYDNIKAEQAKAFQTFKSYNTDRDLYFKKKEEYNNFKESFTKTRENEYERRISPVTLKFDTERNTLYGNYKRDSKSLKKEVSDFKKQAAIEGNKVAYLNKEAEKEIKSINKAKEAELMKAKQIFFFKTYNLVTKSSETITNKMIQGLSTKVFIKEYILDVPHDAYIEVEDGINVTVTGILDFGDGKIFYIAKVDDDFEGKTIYFRLDRSLSVGDKVKLGIDIENCHVTEKGMGLKIY